MKYNIFVQLGIVQTDKGCPLKLPSVETGSNQFLLHSYPCTFTLYRKNAICAKTRAGTEPFLPTGKMKDKTKTSS